ncbi:non-specific lipid transfer protein GPI-anchored 7-like isoform X2 [Phragmites australis]|uniref:non-specific lipid transfer protein GPI-anchored 7-like isoform X2 n=1 Tax=Phragmites australis TaxID=29695 RepID=UPI002D767603|nr:non-specific lipid transfer protein GPI-anchored 7-like isoform X2 [Phragmites australis]
MAMQLHSARFRPTYVPPTSHPAWLSPPTAPTATSITPAASITRSHCHTTVTGTMHSLGRRARLLAVAVAFVAAAAPSSVQAQGTDGTAVPSCAAKLVPCGGYLNSTSTPPASCCGPLKEAAANETACMCAILVNKAALQAFGVAPEQGMHLAKRCGVTTDASACAKYAATGAGAGAATAGSTAASSASTGSSASTVTKPSASGGGTTHRLSLTGASSLVGFSFIWWTIMA